MLGLARKRPERGGKRRDEWAKKVETHMGFGFLS